MNSPEVTAARLSRGQASVIRDLSRSGYYVLGCGEATAIRLLKARVTFPPLVCEAAERSPEGYRRFGLTTYGEQVRQALAQREREVVG